MRAKDLPTFFSAHTVSEAPLWRTVRLGCAGVFRSSHRAKNRPAVAGIGLANGEVLFSRGELYVAGSRLANRPLSKLRDGAAHKKNRPEFPRGGSI